jgi:endo-1,4-beta-xylanase
MCERDRCGTGVGRLVLAAVWVMAACGSALAGPLVIRAPEAGIKTTGGKIAPAENAEGGWNLWNNGELGEYVKFASAGPCKITVRAYGSPAKGAWPILAIVLDDHRVATATVDKAVFADYAFEANISIGIHRFTVAFTNDAAVPDPNDPKKWVEDRNLYVNRIEIESPAGGQEPVLSRAEDWAREALKSEEEAVEETGKQIERNRKGEAVVHVVDAGGKVVSGARVTAELARHEFLFGCNIYMFDRFKTPAENDLYKRRFAELFNFATVGFYWRSYEPKRGQPGYEYTDKVVAWCLQQGIGMKGHPLLWGHEAGIPPWSKGQPDANTQKDRVTEILRRYGGKITLWEVVNEPGHNPEPKIDQPYRWARQADPNACLIVNDSDVLSNGYPPFLELLTRAKSDGVPFDGIGIQAHEPRTMRFPLNRVREILDQYAALGKDLYITEFTPTSSGEPITGSPVTGQWDEKAQADYAVQFYRVCFAHPAVKGITWWDLCDEGSWLAGGGMLRKDLSPKPVYDSLRKLIHEEWHTRAQGATDAGGQFAFRGFAGLYDVTVTAGGKTAKGRLDLSSRPGGGKPATCQVTLTP